MKFKEILEKIIWICYGCSKWGFFNNYKLLPSYWYNEKQKFHKECDNKKNIIEFQTIDADCNDCKYFKRGKLEVKGIFNGHCLKFDKPTKAYPNFCTNHSCFEHRCTK